MSQEKFIEGHYFPYCQWCVNDGHCILRHCEFMGIKPNAEGKVDDTPYRGHENISWHMSGFQMKTRRAACVGKIYETDSIYFPLACECGTVISSLCFGTTFGTGLCAKFQPNRNGKAMFRFVRWIKFMRWLRREEEFNLLEELESIDASWVDHNYHSIMTC
ncbi:MAG: hypothetical protein WC565_00820 [Parcubacteria group bacterium]